MGAPTASAELDQLIEFVNTTDLEDASDRIGTPALFAAWLSQHGTHDTASGVSTATHRRAIDLREGLRALGRQNNEEAAEPERLHALEAATAGLPLIASLSTDSGWRLQPQADGADALLASIVGTAVRAMAVGTWSRVKACRNDTCRWLFLDGSRNRSRTWCTMAVCGSRMKARAYRARKRPDA